VRAVPPRSRNHMMLLIVPWPNARSYIERPCLTVVITFCLVFSPGAPFYPPPTVNIQRGQSATRAAVGATETTTTRIVLWFLLRLPATRPPISSPTDAVCCSYTQVHYIKHTCDHRTGYTSIVYNHTAVCCSRGPSVSR